jgi:hypothetical protein
MKIAELRDGIQKLNVASGIELPTNLVVDGDFARTYVNSAMPLLSLNKCMSSRDM